MATRSVDVTFRNQTSETLTLANSHLDHGKWSTSPPATVGPSSTVQWRSESAGALTGTQGSATFAFAGVQLTLSWNNPYIGANRYDETPLKDFLVVHSGGRGNQASVTFTLQALSDPVSWQVTQGAPRPARVSGGNRVQFFVDGQAIFAELATAIRGPTQSVHLLQLAFSPDLHVDSLNSQTFTELLLEANRRNVAVRILLNENALIPDDFDEIGQFYHDHQPNTASVRRFPLSVELVHAKIVVIDSTVAYIIGPPFLPTYWDTPAHLVELDVVPAAQGLDLAQRGPVPLHDAMIRLEGPAVEHVDELFVTMWNLRSDKEFGGADKLSVTPVLGTSGASLVQIVRTLPMHVFDPPLDQGETGVIEAYERAIAHGQRFIYFENQYVTNRRIAQALSQRLELNRELQVIIALNERPDVPLYPLVQNWVLAEFGLLGHPRVGLFSLWSVEQIAGQHRIERVYMHAKVGIVDDIWATVGTANLDGLSLSGLEEYDISGPVQPISAFKHYNNVEINAVLLPGQTEPAMLRAALWAEHLGMNTAQLASALSTMNPLELWRTIAAANVTSLSGTTPFMASQVLPYSTRDTKMSELEDVGVDVQHLV